MNDHAPVAGEITDFAAGHAEGLDPQPTDDEFSDDGYAVTQATSPWIYLICQTCGQSFRRGDRVARDQATGEVRHLDPALSCAVQAGQGPAPYGDGSDAAMFGAGLLAEWPTVGGVPVTVLGPDAWQVADRGEVSRPPLCQGCSHTFRAGESVVICLCHPHDPGECVTAIHRDPAAGLSCWEMTHPEGSVSVCPWRMVRVPRR